MKSIQFMQKIQMQIHTYFSLQSATFITYPQFNGLCNMLLLCIVRMMHVCGLLALKETRNKSLN